MIWVSARSSHLEESSQGFTSKAMVSVAFDDGFKSKSGRGLKGAKEKV